jgi:hypothetical protein
MSDQSVKANDSSIHNSVDRMRRFGCAWDCIYIIKDWRVFSRYDLYVVEAEVDEE